MIKEEPIRGKLFGITLILAFGGTLTLLFTGNRIFMYPAVLGMILYFVQYADCILRNFKGIDVAKKIMERKQ